MGSLPSKRQRGPQECSNSKKTLGQEYLRQLIEEEDRRSRGGLPRHTVKELLDRFESEHVPVLRSANTYRFAIRNLASRLGSILLDQFSRQHIADFIAIRQNDGVKSSTIKRELVVLSSAMTFAVGWGWAAQSMAGLLERRMLKSSPTRRRYLTHDEEKRLLEAASPRLRPLIIFAIETGLRREEQFSLKWYQIDLDRRELKLFVTKTGTPRIVPLSDRALAVLNELPRYPASPFVFVNPTTGTRYVSPSRRFAAAGQRAEIKDLRWHDLRRTCGCRLIQDHHADLFHVSRWLGHSTTAMTERAYAFLRVQDLHAFIRPGTKTGTVEGE